MPFKEYEAFVEPLALPIGGRVYVIPPVGIRDGLKLATALEGKDTKLSNEEFSRLLLGAAYDELMEANVPAPAFGRVIATALAEYQGGRATAELMWETGGDPKAIPQRTPAGEATSTPRQVSTNGTRTKKPASRSPKSSNSGT